MNITDIRIRRKFESGRMKALVSVTFDQCLALHDIKVIDGSERLFVAMPSRKDEQGVHRDIAHPITAEFRGELERAILDAYHQHLALQNTPQLTDLEPQPEDEIGHDMEMQ